MLSGKEFNKTYKNKIFITIPNNEKYSSGLYKNKWIKIINISQLSRWLPELYLDEHWIHHVIIPDDAQICTPNDNFLPMLKYFKADKLILDESFDLDNYEFKYGEYVADNFATSFRDADTILKCARERQLLEDSENCKYKKLLIQLFLTHPPRDILKLIETHNIPHKYINMVRVIDITKENIQKDIEKGNL